MSIKVDVNTDLLKGERWSEAISEAQKNVETEAVEELESYTPIDTGRLISNWKVRGNDLAINISNETPYAKFINSGTRYIKPRNMVKKSTPKIIDLYEKEILKQIDKIK